jgi:hypothetical protein
MKKIIIDEIFSENYCDFLSIFPQIISKKYYDEMFANCSEYIGKLLFLSNETYKNKNVNIERIEDMTEFKVNGNAILRIKKLNNSSFKMISSSEHTSLDIDICNKSRMILHKYLLRKISVKKGNEIKNRC